VVLSRPERHRDFLQRILTSWRLHNEILDFYDWVAPQPFERAARQALITRVTNALSTQRWFPQDVGRVLSFGSFPAGLYLPTADMDLVYASDRYCDGGLPVLQTGTDRSAFSKTLYKAADRLKRVGLARNVTVIAKARVPIIKFKDKLTNLDVDISFENLSGVQAQATFNDWKKAYPDMIYLVALVKQLLVMRGLNEVHTGGLGGFSIICLIVSFIQHAPQVENLGDCFLSFLKYYGKDFDLAKKRIQMNPPRVLDKVGYIPCGRHGLDKIFETNNLQDVYGIDGRAEQASGLSIQDPNKPDNNISGGSRRAVDAFRVFAEAYDTLMDRMCIIEAGGDVGHSILRFIIGGNYESYIKQRDYLRGIK
jgi:non-canonical poly(A) RNA polymerase PAPD5/7